jgi:predicted ATPase/DNA-binding SARP family transcriptional activator
MTCLTITLLGSFRVTSAGKPVSGFESNKVRALLAYLAVEADQPHRREVLAGLLWPDFPEPSARANLRNALANLRQVIGDRQASPPFLHITRQTIQFNCASDHQLDVAILTTLLAGALDQPTIEQLEEAVAMYQGPFLTGFSIPDSSPFEEWVLLNREALSRQMLDALHQLADHYEQQGVYEQALSYAWRQVELEPWQEEAHRQVMYLLALSDRRSEALAQYEVCRRVLAKELDIEPTAETVALYEQIRAGALGGVGGKSRGAPSPRHNLPVQLTPFVGRKAELADLTRILAAPELRLVTIVGPGGIGKTRLALEAAAAQRQHYKHGVYLISLAPLQSADSLAPTIAEALHFSFYENTPPEQQLLEYLRHKNILLIMDNFEHLLDGVGLVTEILKVAPNLKILATSRTRLRVLGEQLFPLAGLTYPTGGASERTACTDDESQYGAVKLFLQSARRVRPDFVLTNDNLPDVIRICGLLWGMPLGILLASAWIEILTPGEIAAEIEHSFDFLQADLHDIPERQRGLRAVFSHSWQLLSQQEQAIFQQLSIFRGGFSREAAQAVTGASLPDLLAFVNKSLLHHTPAGRYEVHELLRQFAAEKLARSPAVAEEVRGRHSAFYAAFLHQREANLKGARQPGGIGRDRSRK